MFVNMNQYAENPTKNQFIAVLNSVIFNPPPPCHSNASSPYKNSCAIRFYVHQFGFTTGRINLSVVELHLNNNVTTTISWNATSMDKEWIRIEKTLPIIKDRYFLQFEVQRGRQFRYNIAIDDFSMSPECFGFNIPEKHLQEYNYWNQRVDFDADNAGKKAEIKLEGQTWQSRVWTIYIIYCEHSLIFELTINYTDASAR
jgi:anaplastic lymphoma kinase